MSRSDRVRVDGDKFMPYLHYIVGIAQKLRKDSTPVGQRSPFEPDSGKFRSGDQGCEFSNGTKNLNETCRFFSAKGG
jgi:hypothetical protein